MRAAAGAIAAVGACAALVGTAVVASAASFLGVGSGPPSAPSAATSSIPPAMLALYQAAAATCPGLPWAILAAIGTVESDSGQSNQPGVHDGANAAGAEGPMQFLPSNFLIGIMIFQLCDLLQRSSSRQTTALDIPMVRRAFASARR
ncbi:MAG: hypothetical protein ACLPYY_07875 [Acidimicrobiales bacterium]